MAWDDDKSTAADPDNPTADEQLSADEWDAHVADQKGHASRHEKGGVDELTTFGDTTHDSVTSQSINAITWASNNSADYPDVDVAISGASAGDIIGIVPGDHLITSTITQSTDNVAIKFYGSIVKNADVIALQLDGRTYIDTVGMTAPIVKSDVADTTDGVVVHDRLFTTSSAAVDGVGNHGWHFEQTTTDGSHNTNGSVATLKGSNNGGDGIRVDNTSGGASNVNAMDLSVDAFGNSGNGVYIDGFGNYVNILSEGNNVGLFVDGSQNFIRVRDIEVSAGDDVTFEGDRNLVAGYIPAATSVTDNGTDNLYAQGPHITTLRARSQNARFTPTGATNEIIAWEDADGGGTASDGRLLVSIEGSVYEFEATTKVS